MNNESGVRFDRIVISHLKRTVV